VKAEINVTPLVDIVLVLLIIFIVITPAVRDAVRLPVARNGFVPRPEPGRRYLTLILAATRDGAGQVQVEGAGPGGSSPAFDLGDPDGRGRLVGFIRDAVAGQGDRRVFVKADLALPYRQVDQLLKLCRQAGALEASVVTREAKPGQGGS